MARQFIAIDGEGYTLPNGIHLFNLLGASDGSYIDDAGGLDTKRCFNYLPDLDRFNVFYHIEYNPKKYFTVRECQRVQDRFLTLRYAKVFDTFGFFQSSFLGALYTFKIGTPEQLEFISSMKRLRSDFTLEELEQIKEYNQLECELLVKLMETVDNNLLEVNINLSQWHGAGAVAGAVLKREKVKPHLYKPQLPAFDSAVMSAYFGGRVQCLKIGKFQNIYGYDIISAYPSAMNELASLSNATEELVTDWDPDYPYTVYKVKWTVPKTSTLTPFPFRNQDGTIEYPYSGTGFYWQPEVAAAIEVFGKDAIQIVEGYRFNVGNPDSKPFRFIEEMFEFRKELKRRGSMAQVCIKLALNSLYGKMAQGIGYMNTPPPYQCYIHAGLITAITRSKMLLAASQDPDAVISFATDGIITQRPLNLNFESNLGNWEYQTYDKGFIIKPGFYKLDRPEGSIKKVRGFPLRNIDYQELENTWDSEGLSGCMFVPTSQFIGLKSASQNRAWGQWIESDGTESKPHRKLSFYPSKGQPELIETAALTSYDLIPEFFKDGESYPYFKGIHGMDDEKKFSELEYFADDLD